MKKVNTVKIINRLTKVKKELKSAANICSEDKDWKELNCFTKSTAIIVPTPYKIAIINFGRNKIGFFKSKFIESTTRGFIDLIEYTFELDLVFNMITLIHLI